MKKSAQMNIRLAPDVLEMFRELCHLEKRKATDEIEYLIVERLREIKTRSGYIMTIAERVKWIEENGSDELKIMLWNSTPNEALLFEMFEFEYEKRKQV
jgi:hypothetical protein